MASDWVNEAATKDDLLFGAQRRCVRQSLYY